MKLGDVLSRQEADRLPVGSHVRRIDGEKAPYEPLHKLKDGTWLGSKSVGGLGTADWEVVKIGHEPC